MGADGPSEAGVVRVAGLGCAEVAVGSTKLLPSAARAFLVALYLADQRGRRVGRDALAAQVWPGESLQRQRHNLRQVLYTLRRAGMPLVEADATVMLRPRDVSVDWESALTLDVDDAVRRFREPGDVRVLPGYQPARSPALQEWLDEMRSRAEARLQRRLVQLVVLSRREGRWEQAERLAYACLALDPLNEEATLTVAEAAALSGSKTKALKLLDRYLDELGDEAKDLRLPAETLRRRISERVSGPRPAMPARTKLVGRSDLMGALTAALHDAKAGRGSAHLLYGPAGIGKTRLLDEVADTAVLLGGFSVVRVDVVASGADWGSRLGAELMGRLLALPGALGADTSVVSFARSVSQGAWPTLPEAGSSQIPIQADVLWAATTELARAVTQERPLVVAIDCDHIAKDSSSAPMNQLLQVAAARRTVVVVASPTPNDNLDSGWIQHGLGPLQREAALSLLRHINPGLTDPDLLDRLITRSAGHPLFLTVLGRATPSELTAQRLPRTVNATIDRMLDRLSLPARETAEILACAAIPITFDELCAVKHLRPAEGYSLLAALDNGGMLVGAPDGSFTLHTLVRTRLLQRMPSHRVAAARTSLTTVFAQGSSPRALAQTLEYADPLDDTSGYYRAAAKWVEFLLRAGDAEGVIDVWGRLPESVRLSASGTRLLLRAVRCLPQHSWARTTAQAVVNQVKSDSVRAEASVALVESAWANDEHPAKVLAETQRVLRFTEAPHLRQALLRILIASAANSCSLEALSRALQLATLEPYLLDPRSLEGAELGAMIAYQKGDLESAAELAEQLVTRAENAFPELLPRYLYVLSMVHRAKGEAELALSALRRSQSTYAALGGTRGLASSISASMAVCTMHLGSFERMMAEREFGLALWPSTLPLAQSIRHQTYISKALIGPEENLIEVTDQLMRTKPLADKTLLHIETAAAALWAACRIGDTSISRHLLDALRPVLAARVRVGRGDVVLAAVARATQLHHGNTAANDLLAEMSPHRPDRAPAIQLAYVADQVGYRLSW